MNTPRKPKHSYIREEIRTLAVPLKDLREDPRNARDHDPKSLKAIKASLKKYGQVKPLVVNRQTMELVAGNGIFLAAKALKWSHLAVVRVEPDEHAGYALADNRTAAVPGEPGVIDARSHHLPCLGLGDCARATSRGTKRAKSRSLP